MYSYTMKPPFSLVLFRRVERKPKKRAMKEDDYEIDVRTIKDTHDLWRIRSDINAGRAQELKQCTISDQLFLVLAERAGLVKKTRVKRIKKGK